jgi:hypothetical protein
MRSYFAIGGGPSDLQVQRIQIFLINNFNTLPAPPCRIPKIASYAEPGERSKPMATEAQITANRRNAQSSTGPKSVEGKSRVLQSLSIGFDLQTAICQLWPRRQP